MNVFDKPKATDERKQEIDQKISLYSRIVRVFTRREANCPMDEIKEPETCPYGDEK